MKTLVEQNMKRAVQRIALATVSLLVANGMGAQAEAGLIVSVDAPGVQASTVPGVTTETFNEFSPGQYSNLNVAMGTITAIGGQFSIQSADQFGGAGGVGSYIAIGAQAGSTAPVLLTLSGPQAYFGIWVSAADQFNQISFFSGSQLVAAYNAPAGLAELAKLPDADQYFGNPNNGQNPREPYGYLNFSGSNGTTFTSVVLENSGTTATGFESDNWSTSAVAPTTIPGVILGGASTPEPSTLVLAGTACLFGLLVHSRQRKGRAE
jgi:PEP-CTERM motif